jgi:enolase
MLKSVYALVPCCRWMGKGVSKAVDNLNKDIAPALLVSEGSL